MKSIFKFNGDTHTVENVVPMSNEFNEKIVEVVNSICAGQMLLRPLIPFGKEMEENEVDSLASIIFNGHMSGIIPISIMINEITFPGFVEFVKEDV